MALNPAVSGRYGWQRKQEELASYEPAVKILLTLKSKTLPRSECFLLPFSVSLEHSQRLKGSGYDHFRVNQKKTEAIRRLWLRPYLFTSYKRALIRELGQLWPSAAQERTSSEVILSLLHALLLFG